MSAFEVETVDVLFKTVSAPLPAFDLPLYNVIQALPGLTGGDFVAVAPQGDYWRSNTETIVISSFLVYPQTSAVAYLDLRYAGIFCQDPLPPYHFLLQDGKKFKLEYAYSPQNGLRVNLSNRYSVEETPNDAIPFFNADYPVLSMPYYSVYMGMIWQVRFDRSPYPGTFPRILRPSIEPYQVEITTRERAQGTIRKKTGTSIPAIIALVLLRLLGGKDGHD